MAGGSANEPDQCSLRVYRRQMCQGCCTLGCTQETERKQAEDWSVLATIAGGERVPL